MPTFAYKSVVGAMTDPDVGVYAFTGQEGIKHINIQNHTDRTVHDTAADGAVMVSYVSGSSGSAEIETQQTSSLHQFLLNWANVKFTQAENGNASTFAAAALKVVDLINGSIHTLSGVSPLKIPDKPYGPQGGFVTWKLMAANVTQQ